MTKLENKKMKIISPIKKNGFGVANWLTVVRLILMIPFIAIMSIVFTLQFKYKYDFHYEGALLKGNHPLWISLLYWINVSIFIIAMITDFVDGYYARKHKTESTFGKIFDPIADKVATTLMLMFLAILGFSYLPLLVLFIVRDILVDGSRVYAIRKNTTISANIWGKIKTIIVSLAIVALAFSAPWLINATKVIKNSNGNETTVADPVKLLYVNLPLIVGLIIAWVSGIIYMVKYLKGIKNELNEKEQNATQLFETIKASPTVEINIEVDKDLEPKKDIEEEKNKSNDEMLEKESKKTSDQIDFSKTEIFE